MSNYAEVVNGKVTNIIIAEWEDIQNWPGSEFWIEYSNDLDPSTNPKKHPAAIGGNYDEENDIFYSEKLYESWTLNTTDYVWEAPIPYPDDGLVYRWDEDAYQSDNTTGWVEQESAVSGN